MPQMEIRKKNKINKSSCYLANFAQNITSQNGEDGVIGKIFEIMPPLNKFCVEFGAWNGFHLSNTCSLIQIKKCLNKVKKDLKALKIFFGRLEVPKI